jgi:ABC-2 type transport system ATP-binding protein
MPAANSPSIVGRAIDVGALVKRYRTVTALAGVSLSIGPGDIYGLVGSNGAGKTTLIRILLGLTQPSSGKVAVLGQDVQTHSSQIRPRIGYVPENHYLYSWMTVDSLLRFVRSFYPTWNETLCQELLGLFTINPRQKIKQLSKGTVVKLALVIAVAHQPPLLILDEPTSGLDPLVRADFLDVLKQRHRATGQTILFSSHILSDIQSLATHVGILHAGKLLADGTIDQLQKSLRMIRVSLPANGQPIVPPQKTLWHSREDHEYCLAVGDYDESVLAELTAKNQVGVIGVRDITLDEVYLYHVRGTGQYARAAVVERHSA